MGMHSVTVIQEMRPLIFPIALHMIHLYSVSPANIVIRISKFTDFSSVNCRPNKTLMAQDKALLI
jgi:hypothetical protein